MTSNMSVLSAAMSASAHLQAYNSSLPSYLLDKLNELGIDSEDVSSATEAKKLIEEAEESKKAKQEEETEEETEDDGSKSSTREKIENLASKVGVTFSDDDEDDEIMDEIEYAIQDLAEYSARINDPLLYKQVESYKTDFISIAASMSEYANSTNSISLFDDMLAEYNKYSLGLYKHEERDKKE